MTITDEDKARLVEIMITTKSIVQAADVLAYMKQRGSSLTLAWGEDTDQWECAWVSDGNRFTGGGRSVLTAVMGCYEAMTKQRRQRATEEQS